MFPLKVSVCPSAVNNTFALFETFCVEAASYKIDYKFIADRRCLLSSRLPVGPIKHWPNLRNSHFFVKITINFFVLIKYPYWRFTMQAADLQVLNIIHYQFGAWISEWSSHLTMEHWYAMAWAVRSILGDNDSFFGLSITSTLNS